MVKERCNLIECRKKLGMMGFTCLCGAKYCSQHRLPEEHHCSFNHGYESKQLLSDKLLSEKVESEKVNNKL
jgi:predicted nucleic acid binding AN1-type Zn finger protein